MEKKGEVRHTPLHMDGEVLIRNGRASFDYEILETFHAGMDLLGSEVKALKFGRGTIAGAHIILRGGEAYVVNMDVPPYQPNNMPKGYDASRARRLLLTREELNDITGMIHKNGLTLVPIRVYIKGRRVKLEFGLGRGKKKADKREAIRKREWSRLRRDIETR